MVKNPFRTFTLLLVLLGTLLLARAGQAQADSAGTVIDTINQLRAQRGLAALQTHPALMQIAQQHSQYQASLGTWTHTGPDGSSPRERAAAAGFGDGAVVYISENVAYGQDASIMEIINGPWNDPAHHHTMYNPNAKYIGAGVAYSGSLVFYTVDTGYWAGQPGPTPENQIWTSTPDIESPPTAVPVVISTPLADGSVLHIIAGGQSLWTIAAVYDIPLEELYRLNELEPDTILSLGDVVLIQPSYTPTNTPIGEPSATAPPRYTHTPSPEAPGAAPPAISIASPSPTEESPPEPRFQSSQKNPVLIIGAVAVSGLTLLGAVLFSFQKKVD